MARANPTILPFDICPTRPAVAERTGLLQTSWSQEEQMCISLFHFLVSLVDEGKAVDVVYLDFSKAFDTIAHNILLEKLAAYGLDGHILHWVKNWLEPKEWW
ncbi:rna-directed dna polymerase from mobile element jockey-like [Limosa lapponica baueri]|uniref:Rna-directed dna polymerase from mobile element jockey-like n=1 Tax=Limosa lapponica baueri TaxID=1758121 RepID=A0A2I0UE73_LIMLA|nr:rna-directed dna polymerase from mobile element jockey-like [Limosa lapponica baueri]